jgi:prepilin-type N-terminal cleavage/methylation domain-containing protein
LESIIRNENAFTLIELLITLSITLILSSISIPYIKNHLDGSNSRILQLRFQHLIQQAAQFSETRMQDVKLCVGNEGKSIYLSAGGNRFLDVIKVGSSEFVKLRSYPHYHHYLQFYPQQAYHSDNGTLWLCDRSKAKWAIIISQSAMTRIVMPDKNGHVRDAQGSILNCA